MPLLLRPNNFFSSTRFGYIRCIESWTRLLTYLPSFVSFSKYLRLGAPCKAENWHGTSTWIILFSKHHFLGTRRCVFKTELLERPQRKDFQQLIRNWSSLVPRRIRCCWKLCCHWETNSPPIFLKSLLQEILLLNT